MKSTCCAIAAKGVDVARPVPRRDGTWLTPLAAPVQQGICHGDLFSGHCHVTADGRLTLLDFDGCGRGPLAYGLAVYWWLLSEVDRAALPALAGP